MQHFNASAFTAISPAKAKAQALSMFAAAQLDAMPDWHTVALALHAAFKPKPRKTKEDDIAMADLADAGAFLPWNDDAAPGKGTAMLRGRVTVEFADGFSRTVGVLAGKGKPWAIGKAVAFAVACYQADAARRMTGSDAVLYCGENYLPGLISVPEIVSVISDDSDETAAGDLVWSPDAANAATRDMRAGAVDPATYVRSELGEDCALSRARFAIGRALGLMKTGAEIHMARENVAAAERAGALLFPWHRGSKSADDIQAYADLFASILDAEEALAANPRADLAPSDHDTMLAASAIVGEDGTDALASALSAISRAERFTLIEDALLAWPALIEPCAFVDGEPVEEAERREDVGAPPAASLDAAGAAEAGVAPRSDPSCSGAGPRREAPISLQLDLWPLRAGRGLIAPPIPHLPCRARGA